jgi:hypothetical protein
MLDRDTKAPLYRLKPWIFNRMKPKVDTHHVIIQTLPFNMKSTSYVTHAPFA